MGGALSTVSYFTTLSINNNFLTLIPTSNFQVNGINCSGVLAFGVAMDFLIDQVPNYHRIKTGQNKYLTLVQNSSTLPSDVKSLIGPNNTMFFTTCSIETKFYFVTDLVTPTRSTVDIHSVQGEFYICNADTSLFWSTLGNAVMVQSNNGYFAQIQAPTIQNTLGGQGSGVDIDVNGNQVLVTTPNNTADFTATPAGPVLGAYNTGVLFPGFSRDFGMLTSIPGRPLGEMKYLPFGAIVAPDITQSSINSRGYFTNTIAISQNDLTPNFGASVTMTDMSMFLAASSNALSVGFVRIYILSFPTLEPVQTIPAGVGNIIGDSLKFNMDGSVLVFNTNFGLSSQMTVYIKTDSTTWTQSTAFLPVLSGDTSLGAGHSQLGLSKDGRTMIVCATITKTLYIIEDTSVDGRWESFSLNDMSNTFPGVQVRAVCISPEGSIAYAAVDGNQIICFRRESAYSWNNTNATFFGPYPGTNINFIKTSYDGIFTILGDPTLAPSTIGGMAHATNSTLIFTGPITGDFPANPILDIDLNVTMTMIFTVGGSAVLSQTGRSGSVIQNTVNQTIAGAPSMNAVAFSNNNFGSILLFGDTVNQNINILFTSANPDSIFIGTNNMNIMSFNTGTSILSLTSNAPNTNVNPGTPSVTNLGAPLARWNNLYLSNSLFLGTNINDSQFNNGTLTPAIAGTINAFTANQNTPQFFWSRSGNTIFGNGFIGWDTNTTPATADPVIIDLGGIIPGIAQVTASPVIGTVRFTAASTTLPATAGQVNLVQTINPQQFNIIILSIDGSTTTPVTTSATDPAPTFNAAGTIYFTITYNVALT